MITFGTFKERLRTLLVDEDENAASYSDTLLYNATLAALEAIMPWISDHKIEELTADGTTALLVLPDDLYDVEYVYDVVGGSFIPKAVPAHNETRENDWLIYPSGSLNLADVPDSGAAFKVYYQAYWEAPANAEDVDFEMTVPRFAHNGMYLYAKAWALGPNATASADIRRWNNRQDSGNPEHNPIVRNVEHLLKLFEIEMSRIPKQGNRGG